MHYLWIFKTIARRNVVKFKEVYKASTGLPVVIDLSMNSGGDTVTASFMISLFLGEGPVCIQDTLTGAYANECFRADANLDGVYDEKDSLLNYNLY